MRVTTSSVTDDTVGFDGLRAVVGAGDGVVGRFPGIVCVARCSDPEPLREFLAVCAEVAGPEPGRALARRLATWMSGPDAPGPQLRFGTIAAAGDKLAVYLVGEVEAHVDAVGGLRLSGAHAAIGTDRLLTPPASPVVLSMDGGDVRADPADVHDLRAGVVPGAGVVLRPGGFETDDVRHAEEGAGGVHEWFDTGEGADDPFADPPLAPGVPVQRAAGVRVGGRNGVARDVEPEATASTEPEAPGDQVDGTVGTVGSQAAGPGRHALDTPGPPLQPRGEPPVAALGEPSGDPLTDPLPPDYPAADPLGLDARGPTAVGGDPVGAGTRGGELFGADRRGRDAHDLVEPERDPFGAGARGGELFGADARLRESPTRGGEPASADEYELGMRERDTHESTSLSGEPNDPGADGRDRRGLDGNGHYPHVTAARGGEPVGADAPELGRGAEPLGVGGGGPEASVPGPSQGSGARPPVGADAQGYPASPLADGHSPVGSEARGYPGSLADGRSPVVADTGGYTAGLLSDGPPVGAEARGYAGPLADGQAPVGADVRGYAGSLPDGRPPVGADAQGNPAGPLFDMTKAEPPPMPSPAEPVAQVAAAPLEQRRPRPSAGPPSRPSHALEETPRPDALAVPAGRDLPADPSAASLFAPTRPPGSLVDPSAGATPPDGFAPPASRAPETRPPPGPTDTPGSLFLAEDEPPPDQRRGPRIRGYRCENGHLNDPRSPSCRECAAPIDERVGGLVAGPRPALGRLVFDDGAAHVVDGGYLVGGRPDTDDRVRTGELRPIVVADEAGSVAQAHAEIRVSGWDVMVVDAGSHNGTYVSGPDEGQWTPLPPRRSRRLLPGTRVRLGGRVFVFESSSTVR